MAKIYKQNCMNCHGIDGEHKPLNQKYPFSQTSERQLFLEMKGYLDESYGSHGTDVVMKINLIQTYLTKEEDLKEMAKYLKTLKKK
jgi:cytochrome c553